MDRANVVIIGGGVVGCALACELAAHSEDVFLLEQMPKLGMATSTRNSGVVHSGIYYSPGSLKARLCVSVNRLTKEFCAAHGVPHNNCGKLVVASHPAEITELERLAEGSDRVRQGPNPQADGAFRRGSLAAPPRPAMLVAQAVSLANPLPTTDVSTIDGNSARSG